MSTWAEWLCAACACAGELRSSAGLRHYFDLLVGEHSQVKVEGEERMEWGVCWQCEAALRSVARFQRRARTAQRTLCNYESAWWWIGSPRLARSPLVLWATPGAFHDATEASARSEEAAHGSSSCGSEDEALAVLRDRKPPRAHSPTLHPLPKLTVRVKQKKKSKTRKPTKLKKVIIEENEIHSGVEFDEDTREKRGRKENTTKKRSGGSDVKSENVKRKGRQNERFKKVEISEEEMMRGREEERRVKWFVQAPHKCDTCIIGYYNTQHLQEHRRVKHNPSNAHACRVCEERCADERRLTRHAALHYRRIECALCGARHRTYRDMWRHFVRTHEPGKTFPCALCSRVFQTRPSLVYHRRCEHRERCKCEHCGDTFRNQTTYKRHLLIHTGMPTYECGVCRRSYRGKFGFLTHMKTHGPPPRDAYCVECDVQYKHAFQYRRHLKISPRHRPPSPSAARAHPNKYACEACEKKFVSPSVLKRHHDSVHLKLKRYGCQECDKNYATPAALWTHRKMQHERVVPPRDKVCHVCGKGFRSNTSLVDHMRSHTGERPFSCDTCAATFRHNSGLYMHKRLVHKMAKKRTLDDSGGGGGAVRYRRDLPLACGACPATFRHTSGLYVHSRLVHAPDTCTPAPDTCRPAPDTCTPAPAQPAALPPLR